MKRKKNTPAPSAVPNWMLYSGVGLILSLGALKIVMGLARLYR